MRKGDLFGYDIKRQGARIIGNDFALGQGLIAASPPPPPPYPYVEGFGNQTVRNEIKAPMPAIIVIRQ